MKTKKMDVLGISAATLCLIHCLAFPLLMVFPILSKNHGLIDLAFALVGAYAVYRVTKGQTRNYMYYLLWASIGVILLAVLLDLMAHIHTPLIYVGAMGLITGHVLNFKNHKHD